METQNICGACEYAELQCPPVIRCSQHNDHRYLDSKACEQFEEAKEDDY